MEFDDIWAEAGKQVQAIQSNARYSTKHKESATRDIQQAAADKIASRAERKLAQLGEAVTAAEDDYRVELDKWESGQDWARQLTIDRRVNSLVENAQWPAVQSTLDVASRDKDTYTLSALRGALPLLVKKARAAGVNSVQARELPDFEARLDSALDELQPASLQAARGALLEAQQAEEDYRSQAVTFNWKRQRQSGANVGPLDKLLGMGSAGVFADRNSIPAARRTVGAFDG